MNKNLDCYSLEIYNASREKLSVETTSLSRPAAVFAAFNWGA
jgi:hypothetical protein